MVVSIHMTGNKMAAWAGAVYVNHDVLSVAMELDVLVKWLCDCSDDDKMTVQRYLMIFLMMKYLQV